MKIKIKDNQKFKNASGEGRLVRLSRTLSGKFTGRWEIIRIVEAGRNYVYYVAPKAEIEGYVNECHFVPQKS